MGFAGTSYTSRVRGDSLVGIAVSGGDVILMTTDTATDRVESLAGRRLPCSAD